MAYATVALPSKARRPFLIADGKRFPLTVYADHATASVPCPHCKAPQLSVAGTGRRPSEDDQAWEADAQATCCRAYVGTIRVEVSTIFGVREDQAVLQGRCRVY